MHKLLLFFMVCLAIGLTVAGRDKDRIHFNKKDIPSHFKHKPFHMEKKSAKFCSNNSMAQVYLKQMLSIIDNFQANSTYNSILKSQSANFVNYLKDNTNQDLLRTDCENFIKGLEEAKKADQKMKNEQRKLAKTIDKQFKKVLHDIYNGKGFQELDI